MCINISGTPATHVPREARAVDRHSHRHVATSTLKAGTRKVGTLGRSSAMPTPSRGRREVTERETGRGVFYAKETTATSPVALPPSPQARRRSQQWVRSLSRLSDCTCGEGAPRKKSQECAPLTKPRD